jgi:type II secretory pathway predicted ATPase ExeA
MALFTQPDLQPKLNRLKSLKSRMSLAKLRPFTFSETKEMMKFRWTVAGGKQFPFDEEALAEMFRITKGVPRSIVQLANEALIKMAVDKRKVVDKDSVLFASTELTFNEV